MDLNHLRAFVVVHSAGSFAAAAKKLAVPRSSISRAVAALEATLGTRLFHRTTRTVSPSTAGRALYASVAPALQALEVALLDLPAQTEVPSGTLRVTTTADLGVAVLAEATARYLSRYPGTRVDAHMSTSVVDLVREGFDLALRVSGGKLRGSSLVAQRIGSYSLRLYASPVYLARRRAPRSIDDLLDHEFVGYQPARFGLKIPTRVDSNDFFYFRELLKSGAGIGLLPSFLASSEVALGTLVPVLPHWATPTGVVYVVRSSRKHQPPKVTAFREILVEVLRQHPL